jgi:glycosyltransferase involved in cell wall biosynthesis
MANKANALNFGVYLSKHDWIAPIDADDIWLPIKLQKQYDFIITNSSVDILGCQMLYIGALDCEAPRNPHDNETIYWCFARGKNPISFPAVTYKKSIHFRGVGLYNTSNLVIEDYDFWQRCKQQKMIMANLPDDLAVHRIHGDLSTVVDPTMDEHGRESWDLNTKSKTEFRQQLIKWFVDSWYVDWDIDIHGPYPPHWGIIANIREFDKKYDLGPGTPVNSTDADKGNTDV